jgi:Rab5-interacting protein (Rab5ip).
MFAKGLSYGMLLGFIESKQNTNLQGVAGIISGLLVIIFLPMGYINLYLTAQTETYKNLYIQGVNNGLALMLLIWITAFTIIHNEEGFALTKGTLLTFADVVVSDDKSATHSMTEEGLSDNLHSEF